MPRPLSTGRQARRTSMTSSAPSRGAPCSFQVSTTSSRNRRYSRFVSPAFGNRVVLRRIRSSARLLCEMTAGFHRERVACRERNERCIREREESGKAAADRENEDECAR